MGLGLSFFLRCQQSRVRVNHQAAEGDPAEQGEQRRMELVGVNPTRYAEMSVMRVPGPRAVRAAQCKPAKAKGRSQSSPGEAGGGEGRGGLQQRVAVGLPTQGGGGKKLLGPGEVLFLESIEEPRPVVAVR